ncbi:hypothetical protein HPP92_023962 [Vanilla planifolia]|uniref:HAT C-terminal dimerisation domain-containing protein n=1 Tax=Vanilla planifolia TaxID=51239 RepID=A0A835UAW3_VANPL|nr:hypothetical protein HPP92_023962 [Vanilla planifolia]
MMARDMLTIPISTVAPEASFNIRKKMLHVGQISPNQDDPSFGLSFRLDIPNFLIVVLVMKKTTMMIATLKNFLSFPQLLLQQLHSSVLLVLKICEVEEP